MQSSCSYWLKCNISIKKSYSICIKLVVPTWYKVEGEPWYTIHTYHLPMGCHSHILGDRKPFSIHTGTCDPWNWHHTVCVKRNAHIIFLHYLIACIFVLTNSQDMQLNHFDATQCYTLKFWCSGGEWKIPHIAKKNSCNFYEIDATGIPVTPPRPATVKSVLYNESGLANSQESFPSFQNFLRIENRTIIKEVSFRPECYHREKP